MRRRRGARRKTAPRHGVAARRETCEQTAFAPFAQNGAACAAAFTRRSLGGLFSACAGGGRRRRVGYRRYCRAFGLVWFRAAPRRVYLALRCCICRANVSSMRLGPTYPHPAAHTCHSLAGPACWLMSAHCLQRLLVRGAPRRSGALLCRITTLRGAVTPRKRSIAQRLARLHSASLFRAAFRCIAHSAARRGGAA